MINLCVNVALDAGYNLPCLNDKSVTKTYDSTATGARLHDTATMNIGDVVNTGIYRDGADEEDDQVITSWSAG